MEFPDFHVEAAKEHIHHHIAHQDASNGALHKSWVHQVAVLSAIVAALAASASLVASHQVNESMIKEIHAANQWTYFQAKSIKHEIINSQTALLAALDAPIAPEVIEQQKRYSQEQEVISAQAKDFNKEAISSLTSHNQLANAVTLFQVSIAIAAMAVLAKWRSFAWASVVFALLGMVFFGLGIF